VRLGEDWLRAALYLIIFIALMELGCVATVDREGRIIWVADAHRDDGKRFVVRADES
jgi:hypothetical protein